MNDEDEVIENEPVDVDVELPPISFRELLVEQHGDPMCEAIERAQVRYDAEIAEYRTSVDDTRS